MHFQLCWPFHQPCLPSNKARALVQVVLRAVLVQAPVVQALALQVLERVPQVLVQPPVLVLPPQVPLLQLV